MSQDYSKIITVEPGRRGGKPCIRDLRITVYDVLEYLASGMTEDEILADFPDLQQAKISGRRWPSPRIGSAVSCRSLPLAGGDEGGASPPSQSPPDLETLARP